MGTKKMPEHSEKTGTFKEGKNAAVGGRKKEKIRRGGELDR